nr:DUF5658 family protein [Desulfobaculum xiamenense]
MFVALQVADVWSTNRILLRGGRELNPVVRWLMRACGRWWWVPKIVIATACGVYLTLEPWPDGPAVLGLVTAIYVWVVYRNLRQLPRWGFWR